MVCKEEMVGGIWWTRRRPWRLWLPLWLCLPAMAALESRFDLPTTHWVGCLVTEPLDGSALWLKILFNYVNEFLWQAWILDLRSTKIITLFSESAVNKRFFGKFIWLGAGKSFWNVNLFTLCSSPFLLWLVVLGDSHFFISFKGVLPLMIGSVPAFVSDDADNACVFTGRDSCNCYGAGWRCAEHWGCPLWCWRRLRSLTLIDGVLALALTVDSGPGDAGWSCADRWDVRCGALLDDLFKLVSIQLLRDFKVFFHILKYLRSWI